MPSTGWPRTGSGTNSSGGAEIIAMPPQTSFGAFTMKSRKFRTTSRAIGPGYISIPPSTIGPTGCTSNSNSVTTPKLPPPPRMPQKSSGFSTSDTVISSPSAVTSWTERRLSQVSPSFRSSHPEPLPSASPATPVVDMRPPVMASPCS